MPEANVAAEPAPAEVPVVDYAVRTLDEFFAEVSMPKAKAKTGPKSKAKAKGSKMHRNAPAGKQICFNWNRADGGCTEPCPAGRAHMCERCLQPHRGHGCTKKPSGGKGGGKTQS